ncbi:MAG: methyltransferase domain-containing protein [Sphingobacteriales bacterium]|nr:MAG: methyltransferase domain-containing protein [Sphingobacteriales bacterium]
MALIYRIKKLLGFDINQLDVEIHKKQSEKVITDYLNNNSEKKLQIGAQGSPMQGWLNVDILPKTKDTAYMDATKKFPIQDNTFDFIFAEHMIEHITFDEAKLMLNECFRTLKPNGVIRLATPNLDNLALLLSDPTKKEHLEYIQFYVEKFYGKEYPNIPALQINKIFYAFHHRFIHNFESLEYLLMSAKFNKIKKCQVYKSENEALKNIEKHANMMGETNNLIETFVVEATK